MATALTPIAFFETVVVRSYENLVDSDTTVDVDTGIVAAGRLQAVIGSRDYSIDIAEMRVQVGKISEAVRSVVPEIDVRGDHREAGGAGAALAGARRQEDGFDADDPYDPMEFAEDDDEF